MNTEKQRRRAEFGREFAEGQRQDAEEERHDLEEERQIAERQRQTMEEMRQTAEEIRESAESLRESATKVRRVEEDKFGQIEERLRRLEERMSQFESRVRGESMAELSRTVRILFLDGQERIFPHASIDTSTEGWLRVIRLQEAPMSGIAEPIVAYRLEAVKGWEHVDRSQQTDTPLGGENNPE